MDRHADPPLAHHQISDSLMEIEHPGTHHSVNGDWATVYGSELLCRAGIEANVATMPAGGKLVAYALNPTTWQGSRISRIAQTYEQYQIESMAIEYVPQVAATQPGGLVVAVDTDAQSSLGLLTGDAALREMLARPGSKAANVWSHIVTHIPPMQQKQYFDAVAGGDVGLTIPATYYLAAGTDFATSATAIPLGLIWVHYVIRFRVPALLFDHVAPLGGTNVVVTWPNTTVDTAVNTSPANTPVEAGYLDGGVIGCATIIGLTDAGVAGWRNWIHPDSGDTYSITTGMTIFFRYSGQGGGAGVYYWYPDLDTALDSTNVNGYGLDNTWQYSATYATGGTLRLGNVHAILIDA